MIFFGTKSKSIKKGMLTNIHCEYCNEESDMEYDFQQKYFHLYLIEHLVNQISYNQIYLHNLLL